MRIVDLLTAQTTIDDLRARIGVLRAQLASVVDMRDERAVCIVEAYASGFSDKDVRARLASAVETIRDRSIGCGN